MPETIQPFPHIIAQRLDGALLVALDAQTGCIYEPDRRIVYPRMGLATLMAQPYWQRYQGPHDALNGWPGPPLASSAFLPPSPKRGE